MLTENLDLTRLLNPQRMARPSATQQVCGAGRSSEGRNGLRDRYEDASVKSLLLECSSAIARRVVPNPVRLSS